MDANKLTEAYDDVAKRTDSAFISGVVAVSAKEEFETKSLEALMAGNLTGKNEAERKAGAIALFPKEYQAMKTSNDAYEMQRNELAMAKIHLDCLRDILRVEELAKA